MTGIKSLKVNAAIQRSGSSISYTAPSNGYAIVNITGFGTIASGTAQVSFTVGGETVASVAAETTGDPCGVNVGFDHSSGLSVGFLWVSAIYVGPGQTLSGSSTGTGGNVSASGVEFVNG